MQPLEERKKAAALIVAELKRLFPEAKMALNYSNVLELLIAVILSAQCTDKRVNIVTEALFKKYPTLDAYLKADFDEFCQDIRSTGFYKSKAKNVLATVKKIKEEFGGEVPRTMEEMLTLSGVARKTANVVLSEAYGIIEGIAVDTHVTRLTNKFGLTDKTDPVKIEKDLMEVLPREEWPGFTRRLIAYGREYSPAHKKMSAEDPISKALS